MLKLNGSWVWIILFPCRFTGDSCEVRRQQKPGGALLPPSNQPERLPAWHASADRTAAAVTTSTVRNQGTFTTPSVPAERAALAPSLLGGQWEVGSTAQETLFMTRQVLYPSYLWEWRTRRQLGTLPARPRGIKHPSPPSEAGQGANRQPALPGAGAEANREPEDQRTSLKETAQAVTVNDFYF